MWIAHPGTWRAMKESQLNRHFASLIFSVCVATSKLREKTQAKMPSRFYKTLPNGKNISSLRKICFLNNFKQHFIFIGIEGEDRMVKESLLLAAAMSRHTSFLWKFLALVGALFTYFFLSFVTHKYCKSFKWAYLSKVFCESYTWDSVLQFCNSQ